MSEPNEGAPKKDVQADQAKKPKTKKKRESDTRRFIWEPGDVRIISPGNPTRRGGGQ